MEILKDKVWLVKVPELVYNKMLNGGDVGRMEIYETSNPNTREKTKDVKIRLSNIDTNYFDLNYNKTENFFTFKDKKNKIKKVDLLGRFVANDEYVSDRVTMNVAKEELTNKPSVAIEYGKGRPQTEGIIPISVHQFYATTDTMQKAINQKNRKDRNLKKTRMDREELKREIFNIFTEKDFWTNKELAGRLDQPDNYLKEVMLEMCNYIKSGPKKGCYELKPQYLKSNLNKTELDINEDDDDGDHIF
jgi:hypothetical protein